MAFPECVIFPNWSIRFVISWAKHVCLGATIPDLTCHAKARLWLQHYNTDRGDLAELSLEFLYNLRGVSLLAISIWGQSRDKGRGPARCDPFPLSQGVAAPPANYYREGVVSIWPSLDSCWSAPYEIETKIDGISNKRPNDYGCKEKKRLFLWKIMMTSSNRNIFRALLTLLCGNSPVTGEFPHIGQWRGAMMFSLIGAQANGWVNNRDTGDLIRHSRHYDVTVMWKITLSRTHEHRGVWDWFFPA